MELLHTTLAGCVTPPSASSSSSSSSSAPSSPSPSTSLQKPASDGGKGRTSGPFAVAVEGNISVGKSTMVRNIGTEYPSLFGYRLEAVDQGFNGKLLYQNPAKYAWAMQWGQLQTRMGVGEMITRLKGVGAPPAQPFFLWDRSIIGDFVFCLTNYLLNCISDTEMDVYFCRISKDLHGYDDFVAKCGSLATNLDAILYVDGSPSLCHDRMLHSRKDKAEEAVPIDYLAKLDSVHFCVLRDIITAAHVPVYVKLTPVDLNTFYTPKEARQMFEEMASGKLKRAAFASTAATGVVECQLKAIGEPNNRFPRVRYYDPESLRPVWAALAAGRQVHLT